VYAIRADDLGRRVGVLCIRSSIYRNHLKYSLCLK
jgi:hypothetical protein